jgi:hypothetical protein
MRTVITFDSDAFHTEAPKPDVVDPAGFGDDLARWLAARLQIIGHRVDPDVEQDDYGWYLMFEVADGKHCVVVGFRPDDDTSGDWIAWVERDRGLLRSMLGGRRSGIAASAVRAVHDAMQAPEIRNLRWHDHDDFDAGREELGSPIP